MSLKNLDIKLSYVSMGKDNISDAFLVPALKQAVLYRRSVGFFSSGVLAAIIDGIVGLSRNGGKIQLIASPRLDEDDIEAINLGYQAREEIISGAFTKDFNSEIERLDDSMLQLLAALIANDTLDIKIAVTETLGIYHDKLGILEDSEGNRVVFYGSPNSSLNAYQNNYEKIRVVKSWNSSDANIIDDECEEFEKLWSGLNPYVHVLDYTKAANMNILQLISKRKASGNSEAASPIKLRDYQIAAINAWVENNYHGFYVMATGTGKTWTAIFSAKKLFESHPGMLVICAPYKHLVRQWSEDLIQAFPHAKLIMVSSENQNWDEQITQEIIRKRYHPDNQIIIVSTIASFRMPRFMRTLNKSDEEKLLIVDEAHRFTDRPETLKKQFKYLLGLSATPFSGISAEKGLELMDWFGGQVFNLPIEEALDRNYLVPYHYYPIYVESTSDEEARFRHQTQNIISCFRGKKCINPDLLVKSIRNRLRIISMAEEKMRNIDDIISKVMEKDHFVVYCGDGRLFDNEAGEELRQIQAIKKVLNKHGYKSSQFTATENMKERMDLVDAFNKQEISALAAIRCLDEGINIPSIKSALILSSNDDYREFVQRRGRILRLYGSKKYANIYDVIVLPSYDMQGWAKIEFRRFLEYARLALNWNELKDELESKLQLYGLTIDDIDVYDYDNMEVQMDE